MTRLIDADKLIEKIEKDEFTYAITYYQSGYNDGLFHARIVVDNFPTVDTASVIRCKDCKYCSVDRYADGNVPDYVCIEMDCGVEADGFCAWAERKEEY